MTGLTKTYSLPWYDINAVALDPGHSEVAVGSYRGLGVLSLEDGGFRQLETGQVTGLAWGEKGIIVSGRGRTQRMSPTGEVEASCPGEGSLGLLSSSGLVVRVAEGEKAQLLDGVTLETVRTLDIEAKAVVTGNGRALLALPDGVLVIDEQGEIRHRIDLEFSLAHLALDPGAERFLAASFDRTVIGTFGGEIREWPVGGAVAFVGELILVKNTLYRLDGTPWRRLRADRLLDGTLAPVVFDDDSILAVSGAALHRFEEVSTPTQQLGLRSRVKSLALSRDGRWLAGGTDTGQVVLWKDHELHRVLEAVTFEARALCWLDSSTLLVGVEDGIDVWDPSDSRRRAQWTVRGLHPKRIVAREGRVLVVGHRSALLFSESGEVLKELGPWTEEEEPGGWGPQERDLTDGDLHPDGTVVLGFREGDGIVVALDGEDKGTLRQASNVVFDDSCGHLLSGNSSEALLRSWPLRADDVGRACWAFQQALPGPDGLIWCNAKNAGCVLIGSDSEGWVGEYHDDIWSVAASPDADRFYTAGGRSWVACRDASAGALVSVLPTACGHQVRSMAFDPKGEHLAVGDYDGRIHLWKLAPRPKRLWLVDSTSLQPKTSLIKIGDLGSVNALSLTHEHLLAGSHRLSLWENPLQEDLSELEPTIIDEPIRAMTPNGARFVTGQDWGGEGQVMDSDGSTLMHFEVPDGRERWTLLSDDGRRLLTASCPDRGSDATLWDVDRGARIGVLHVDRGPEGMSFMPDGSVVMWFNSDSGNNEGLMARWDPEAERIEPWHEELLPLNPFDCQGMAFGGGHALLWGAVSRVVRADGSTVQLPPHEMSSPRAGAVSPCGRWAVTADFNGEIHLSDLGTGELAFRFCSTQDGGWWVEGAGELERHPGPWAAPEKRRQR